MLAKIALPSKRAPTILAFCGGPNPNSKTEMLSLRLMAVGGQPFAMLIELERFSYAPDGTFGRLRVGDLELFTCEQPWNGNAVGESCIPAGGYILRRRESPIVAQSTGGEFNDGWEICDVPGRSLIMIHPANWPHELRGCVAPGVDYRPLKSGKAYLSAVTNSRKAHQQLREILDAEDQHKIRVYQYCPEYP